MKVYCNLILITLAIVHVPSVMTVNYANSVLLTNKHIEEAYRINPAGLKTAIQNIINGDATMEKINMMWAIPDAAYLFYLPKVTGNAEYKAAKEELLRFKNGHLLRLGHYDEINAVAEQEAVRKEIINVTNIPVPEFDQTKYISNDLLPQLGEERRSIIAEVGKTLLLAELEKFNEKPESVDFTYMCRLIGLLRSTKSPYAFTKDVWVPSKYVCMLLSFDGIRYRYKEAFGKIVVEVPIVPNTYVSLIEDDRDIW
ncbi:uncharacterized protein LOC126836842 [Adelges cooleyi]|uniref:uncharacterized protein LOC126836842 n=1 Tax=Adelges cooleyi TaxID=133065 RepID=UPI0021802B7B|nr:uncharacterized protein LOC126836842 [Adelges cooleyi]